MPLSLARPASEFQNRLLQTAVDPFTDRIVCRVTKISPARVASGLQVDKKNKPVNPAGYPRWAYFSCPTYYAIGERVHGSLDEPIGMHGMVLLKFYINVIVRPMHHIYKEGLHTCTSYC